MLRVVVMVSGGGTNLQAILDSVQSGEITDTEIVGVISNNPGAYALERGEKAGVPVECISPKSYASRAEFNQEFLKAIDSYEPDLIVLAGFLVVIPPEMIQKYRNRIINIHPSLIPSFCGQGYYGLKVHEAALAYGGKPRRVVFQVGPPKAAESPAAPQPAAQPAPAAEDKFNDLLALGQQFGNFTVK